MPKTKNYEFDYEWNGNNQPQKGVNIKTKNPFAKPLFASVKQPSKSPNAVCSTPEQAPTDIDELRKSHPWQKPQWATVDKGPQKNARDIDREAIPKPMLKKTPGTTTNEGIIHADDDAIAAMERKLAAAKQRKAELLAKQQSDIHAADNADEDPQRTKHTVEETKLERARRLAKERELERWRATLKERNERDKAKRAAAALVSNVRDDTAWQTKKSPAAVVPSMETACATEATEQTPGSSFTHGHDSERVDTGNMVVVEANDAAEPDSSPPPPEISALDDNAAELARQIAQLELELKQYQ